MADADGSQPGTRKGSNGDSAAVDDLESVVIRFAGDSGDGMQLTGTEFTRSSALVGNDIATFPDIPAEIRAPAGTTYGVSGFQVQFSSNEIFTAGDEPQVLVAMNPAALKTNLPDLIPGGTVILDTGSFKKKNLDLAGYTTSPLDDESLNDYNAVAIDMARAVTGALKGAGLSTKEVQRTRNFYALGVCFWLYGREPKREAESIRAKFARRPQLAEGNVRAFEAGYAFGETTELLPTSFHVGAAPLAEGKYRNITGNEALALGLVASSLLADRRLFYASYPITPASSILEAMASYRRYPVTAFQAEDEIAAVTAAIGASFGGSIAVTGTSGPGFALKQEGVGLAVMAELPLVVIDVQRAGPSTGLPTKAEQADLMQAIYGRNSESPVAVIAPATPAECFTMAIEAVRIAVVHMCPVVLLSDNTLATGAEPWLLPDPESLPRIPGAAPPAPEAFAPYLRDPDTLARPWVPPGVAGLEHRIGGLEKEDVTGDVSYDPENHEHMVRTRQAKVDRIANTLEPAEVFGDEEGELLIVGFGGTFGALHQAVQALRSEGQAVSHLHLRYMNPLQHNVGEILARFRNVLVAELNSGQLRMILRSRFLVDAVALNKMQGQPFKVREVIEAARELLPSRRKREMRA